MRATLLEPARRRTARRASLVLVSAGALGSVLAPARAQACGPCSVPELWGIEELRGVPVVVANFGLLHREGGAWRVTCEEIMGGLLRDARGNENASFVSTDIGLFQQSGDLCEWRAGPSSVTNSWALDFSVGRDASTTDSFALMVDFDTSRLHVERSRDGLDFTVVHSFESTSGYRELEVGGDPSAVFVSGHGGQPRVWKLAFSLDAGESWQEATPDVGDDPLMMRLQALHPLAPRSVFVRGQAPEGQGDELWLFDAERGAVERLLTLEDGERIAGMAFSGDSVWIAGRRAAAGSLYRATQRALEFSRVSKAGPAFDCLAAHEGVLYACVNDFTYSSEFVLGSSRDDGATWQAEMTLQDLGAVASCGPACRTTLAWLKGVYGSPGGAAGAGGEASAGSSSAAGGSSTRGRAARGASGSCQARSTAHSREQPAWAVGLFVALVALRRRRAQWKDKRRQLLMAGTLLTLLACSDDAAQGPKGTLGNQAGAAGDGCAGRGDDLSALELETDSGLRLTLLEHSPDPPAVGDNSWLVELSDAEGKALSDMGEWIVVMPFMPEHGHGTPVSVGVHEEGPGEYRLEPVNTFMPGLWQIQLTLADAEEPQALEFSVCVQ